MDTEKPGNHDGPKEGLPGRAVVGVSRFIVSLMWAILLVVVVFVTYLAIRFYQ